MPSNTVTVQDMIGRVQSMTDLADSTFVSAPEIVEFLQEGLIQLQNLLVTVLGEDYFATTREYIVYSRESNPATYMGYVEFDDVGNMYYDFSTPWRLLRVDRTYSDGIRRRLERINPHDADLDVSEVDWETTPPKYDWTFTALFFYPRNLHTETITITFVPRVPRLSGSPYGTAIPGYLAQWEEYAVLYAAILCAEKEERSTATFERRLAMLTESIRAFGGPKDMGSAPRIVDRRGVLNG